MSSNPSGTASHPPLLIVSDLSMDLGGRPVLRGISFEVRRGEQWAIVGPSGSGKTSLASALAGRAFCKGRIDWPSPEPSARRARVALVEQGSRFGSPAGDYGYYQQRYNAADADEGATLGSALGDPAGIPPGASRWIELLQLTPLLSRSLLQLSSGERKRAQIAKALAADPDFLLLDDPFAGVDSSGRAALGHMLRSLCAAGTQVMLFLSRGEVPDFVTHAAELRAGELSPPLARDDFLAPERAVREKGKTAAIRVPPSLARRAGEPSFEIAVRLVDAVVRYGDLVALDRVSWEVRRGERWSLVGPNGAGKTSLLSLITADHPQAYANEMYLFDRRRGSGETIWDIKRNIGFVSPELHAAFPRNASCEDVVASGLFDSIGVFGKPSVEEQDRVALWLDAIGVEEDRGRTLDELPLGHQRMLLLARALVKDPPLLILDEPCQGLDEEQASLFLGLLDSICEGGDTTMIYVSHLEAEIPECATKRLRLEGGRVADIRA